MTFDYWLGNIANSIQTLTFIFSAGLVFRAAYLDLSAYRRRDYFQNIVVSLNQIRLIAGFPCFVCVMSPSANYQPLLPIVD